MILCCLCLPYSGSGLLYCFCPPCYAEILILFCPSYTQVYCLMLALFVQGLLATLAISVLTLSCLYRACLQQQYKGFQSALCIRTAQSGPGTVCVCVRACAYVCVCVCSHGSSMSHARQMQLPTRRPQPHPHHIAFL